jgi:hypothetical protein
MYFLEIEITMIKDFWFMMSDSRQSRCRRQAVCAEPAHALALARSRSDLPIIAGR